MKINPKQIEKIAKQMGISTKQIDAEEVVIRTAEKEIVIRNPTVSKMNMMGQETFQISGEVIEMEREPFSSEYVKTVIDQTGATEEDVRRVMQETLGDMARTILILKKKKEQ